MDFAKLKQVLEQFQYRNALSRALFSPLCQSLSKGALAATSLQAQNDLSQSIGVW